MKPFIITLAICLSLNVEARDFTAVALGDTGKGNQGQYDVGEAMRKKCDQIGCEFGLLLGDNFYQVGVNSVNDEQFQSKFEKPYANIKFPFFVALGNHDYGKTANEWQKANYEIEYSKYSKKWILPAPYYSFTKEDVLFLVLDTSRLFHDKDTQKQKDYFRNILKNNAKKWVVVVAHHPYISNGSHGNAGKYDGITFSPYSGSVIKKFVELDLCAKADLFISGHDHELQTLKPTAACPKTLFVVSGGGAEVKDDLKGKNPVYFQKSVLGFTTLNFKQNEIIVSHVNVNGGVEHSLNIVK